MGSRHAMLVVEPRLLFREGLKALMAKTAYHVVSACASAAEIDGTSIPSDEPQLVILGAAFAHSVFTEAVAIRKLLPKAKIVLLYESLPPSDFQKVRESQIDGCIPSSVSVDTLVNALDLIIAGEVRTIVLHASNDIDLGDY
jgi:DNA-binding NarL/FixJ family response regulator